MIDPPLLSALPFCLLLAAIAILPLVAGRWWVSNRNRAKVVAALALPFAVYMIWRFGAAGAHQVSDALLDYISFMVLLGSLFVIAGGVHVRGSLAGTPLANTAMLGIGAVLANLIGTTGASMVLIRPFLRANDDRRRRVHQVVFFIFVISNCGGLLTPLGDPPLFLGFLKGVPFEWTLRLWKEWLFVVGALLLVFHFVDEWQLEREEARSPREHLLEKVMEHEPLGLEGARNLIWLAGVVAVIVGKGQGWGAAGGEWPFGVQEGLMIFLAVAAYATTSSRIRQHNRFDFAPIVEVAILFAGIFVTMTAPLALLNHHGSELGLTQPWHYFWATGAMSSFLDNAPTYLTFAAAACGLFGVQAEGTRYLAELLARGPEAARVLEAVSCGAVFMGANTYIGNGPNFMVKAIAEENGVRMPSFFGYMAWAMMILMPLFLAVTLVFYR